MSNFQYESEFSEASINTLDDRRREIRFNDGERAVIVWSHNAEARGPMELINRSQQGLCVRSEDAVPPGALGTILPLAVVRSRKPTCGCHLVPRRRIRRLAIGPAVRGQPAHRRVSLIPG